MDTEDRPNLRLATIELQEYERLRHPTRLPGKQIVDTYLDWLWRQTEAADGVVLVVR
jgi:hypothetical protein